VKHVKQNAKHNTYIVQHSRVIFLLIYNCNTSTRRSLASFARQFR